MFIMTANGWRPLYTLSEPKLEGSIAYAQLDARTRSDGDLYASILAGRADFEREQTQALLAARQRRVDNGQI